MRSALLRRVVVLDDVGCVFCEHDWEDVDHLFPGCNFAYNVWIAIYSWLGFVMIQHNQVKYHYVQHGLVCRGKRLSKVCHFIWHATCWCLWLHRNRIIFQEEQADVQLVVWHI
ncbi:hypothetical protein GLYMA_05G248850v4 [Glycine max]|nr:hypothetical protein GLYMA_05G248850v4 [Glycine max]KAH1079907.1 hypothetical protein GYH30_057033 [Glycine max]